MEPNTKIVYRIDSQDRIVYVNDNWHKFAEENDALELTKSSILYRSLWDFITDETSRHFYREVIQRVRADKPVFFNFRCDSPSHKRLMGMNISYESGEVVFQTDTIRLELRKPQSILDRNKQRSDEIVVICGWCKKINMGKMLWKEIEHAIAALKIFEAEKLPMLSHGMCNNCYVDFFSNLKNIA
ncbi:MAG TPA: hypothetical protein PKY59_13515 [Pyrinomonadaceae bacterium]|nr:hypothetical protein [Pyrinomonadaceae bacterium]